MIMNFEPNDCLIIRNFQPTFNYIERNQLFYGLGARTVHNYPHYTVAFFENESICRMVIRLLHQKVIHSRRLRVEFYNPNNGNNNKSIPLHSHTINDVSLKQKIQHDQQNLDQFEPNKTSIEDVDLFQIIELPFPRATSSIVSRIARQLLNNEQFYNLVLRLMLRLRLEPPFGPGDDDDYLEQDNLLKNSKNDPETTTTLVNESESELESDHETITNSRTNIAPDYLLNGRKRKRRKLMTGFVGDKLNLKVSLNLKKKESTTITTKIEEVFDDAPKTCLKKSTISLDIKKVPVDSSLNVPQSTNQLGQFGTLDTSIIITNSDLKPVPIKSNLKLFDLASLTKDQLVSEKELEDNRLPPSEWSNNPLFSRYTAGDQSCRLYVKNLHRKTTIQDLYRIYARFIDLDREEEVQSFDVVYMDKGRMRGQAFVTFPDEMTAEMARIRTNGYLVHGKPIVVVFARSCKSKNED